MVFARAETTRGGHRPEVSGLRGRALREIDVGSHVEGEDTARRAVCNAYSVVYAVEVPFRD